MSINGVELWILAHLNNELQLLQLDLSGEKRFANHYFGQYAAHTPGIHTRSIPSGTEQKFRWTVPQRNNAVGKISRDITQPPCEAKIRELCGGV